MLALTPDISVLYNLYDSLSVSSSVILQNLYSCIDASCLVSLDMSATSGILPAFQGILGTEINACNTLQHDRLLFIYDRLFPQPLSQPVHLRLPV